MPRITCDGLVEKYGTSGVFSNPVPRVNAPCYISESDTGECNGFMENMGRISSSCMRIKPSYADSWLLGSADNLEVIAEYRIPGADVVVGMTDGETEYNLMPDEYVLGDSVNAVISKVIDEVRDSYRKKGGKMNRMSVLSDAKSRILGYSDTIEAVYGNNCIDLDNVIEGLCETVYRYTAGLGIFEILLADPKLEDIYIDAPCDKNRVHITMNGIAGVNSNLRCRTNLMVDRKEIMNLVNVLKRESGLSFCESEPVLETDMSYHEARATVVGYPMSPNGDAVSIRKHSTRPWTLSRLVANGTIDGETAGLLSYLVDNRCTFLICGARGAGKSSLLSALMFEFPLSQRILTIEDTMELPGEKMRKMGYKVQSMLVNERMDGNSLSRADEALRVSLRMGESAIVLGEVRGGEARTLYQCMRTGRAGSSIMGTIHGDSAKTVYDRVVHDMGIAPEAFMATDVLVTLGTFRDKVTGNQTRKMTQIVATGKKAGSFVDISQTKNLRTSPVVSRILSSTGADFGSMMEEVGIRGRIRTLLAELGQTDEKYLGPEWINLANEHVAKNQGVSADEVLRRFEVKLQRNGGE